MNWQQEANAYQAQLLADLTTLLKIPSVRDDAHATAQAPFGPGPSAALKQFLAFAERDGFATKNVANVAGRIAWGDGPQIFGLFGHVDVVPAGAGWASDPFTPVIKDGKLYARGAADDKGPSMAAYYALRLLKDHGIAVHQQIHFILGTDEESEWGGITRYLQTEPTPDYGFSPDAQFPIINGEKGIASFQVAFIPPRPQPAAVTLESFAAGIRVNMVPQTATATLRGTLPADFAQTTTAFATQHGVQVALTPTATATRVTVTGKGAHALAPENGVNAATFLAALLASLPLDPAGHQYVQTIATTMHEDSRGHRLGINYTDKLMGELTVSPDLFHFEQDGPQTVTLNIRYPQGTDAATIRDQIETTLDPAHATVTIAGHAQAPHYVSGSDPLVKTLLAVFARQTGLPAHEAVIGGGTYGRIIKRGVAFGAMMPDAENVMHQANEYMPVQDILRAVAIYAEAIARLVGADV